MPLPPLPPPERAGERLRRRLRAAPALAGLTSSLFAFNGVQMSTLLLRPVSAAAFRRANRWAADTWWGWTVETARRLHGVDVIVSGDELPDEENAIVVANHQQMPDITFLMHLARQKGRLGDMKWVLKRPLKYVPGMGWGLAFLDAVFVTRDWTKDRETIDRTFAHLRDNAVPLWLILFVEGTRMGPDKLASSQAYAREKGWPEPAHVLVPRTKGFVAAVQGLRTHVPAVYDVTIGYEEGVPTLGQYALGLAPRAHLHVRRHAMAALPEEPERLAAWLRERWQEKDVRMAGYYERGVF